MITINKKANCSGCEVCATVCPKNCISMEEDFEGFLYPVVDKSSCTNCGLCERLCPLIKKSNRNEVSNAYAVQHKSLDIRLNSSSGGAFTAIAEYALKKNGHVYGVVFDNNLKVVHSCASDGEQLAFMRGSKYVQSRVGETYKKIKVDLQNNLLVCFSGTPCQVEGLYNYLGKKYENLITIDFVCHGVASPKVWRKYISELEKKYNSNIMEYSFRSKKMGFHDFGTQIMFKDGREVFTHDKGTQKDFMHLAFFAEICSRPACHSCNFKGSKRVSDFTIFDCWHVEEFNDDMEDDKGTSMIFIHNSEGEKIFDEIKGSFKYSKVNYKKAIELDGLNILYSMIANKKREEFFQCLNEMSIDELQQKFLQLHKKNRLYVCIKKILISIKVLEILRRYKYKLYKKEVEQ